MSRMLMRDPFETRYTVPVNGGELAVARSGPPPEEADTVVLGVHGVASSHAIWTTVARELAGSACLLAPDLRGRGHSASLPGPYGMSAHVADLLAVLDDAGVERAVLAGHSMGAFVVSGLAAEQPERVSAAVLLDGGLPIPSYPREMEDELIEAMVEAALGPARTFASVEEHVAQWREHPAFAADFNDDVEAYARADVAGANGTLHAAASVVAVRDDVADLVRNEAARTAIDRVRAPISLLHAGGTQHQPPMVPRMLVDAFVGVHPHARVEAVPEANHYTLVLGAGPGPARVAAALRDAAAVSRSATSPSRR
jgi:lipase